MSCLLAEINCGLYATRMKFRQHADILDSGGMRTWEPREFT